MKTMLLLSAAALALGTNTSVAADAVGAKSAASELTAPSATDDKGHRCHMREGMMEHGPMGGRMGQMIMVPGLPAGNEKLELQMHAEILQKIGEIESKYAAQLN